MAGNARQCQANAREAGGIGVKDRKNRRKFSSVAASISLKVTPLDVRQAGGGLPHEGGLVPLAPVGDGC